MSRNLYFEDELIEEKFNKFMLGRLISYASDYKADYIKVILFMIATGFLSLIPAAINMKIINDILPQNGVVPDNVIRMSIILLSLWVALSLGGVVAHFITTKVTAKLGNTIDVGKLKHEIDPFFVTIRFPARR